MPQSDRVLREFLVRRRSAILERWLEAVRQTYPPETAKFLKTQRDPIANPMGAAIADGLEAVLGELFGGPDAAEALERLVRLRALQESTPSRALSFLLVLKDIVRSEAAGTPAAEDLPIFFSQVDRVLMRAFDMYASCREKMHELKVEEARRRTSILFERLGVADEAP